MANILLHPAEEGVTLSAPAAKKLVERGDGDAALLYLCLLRHRGTVPPRSLAGELRWDRGRLESAERTLQELGLVSAGEESAPPEPVREAPTYPQEEIAQRLEEDEPFRRLTAEVDRRLGRRLTTPDLGILLSLREDAGLPEDVIYLLVCHCAQRVTRQYGPGRRPTLRQIEKEGYAWARLGIDTQAAAAEYLKTYARRQGAIPAYMRALNLGDRAPVASEEKYLLSWQEMGFPPEAVALACDKTVLKCHELKWAYCNAILKRWHQAGLHTVAQIEAEDRPAPRRGASAAPSQSQGAADEAWKYV